MRLPDHQLAVAILVRSVETPSPLRVGIAGHPTSRRIAPRRIWTGHGCEVLPGIVPSSSILRAVAIQAVCDGA
jgi:hypothetical protein